MTTANLTIAGPSLQTVIGTPTSARSSARAMACGGLCAFFFFKFSTCLFLSLSILMATYPLSDRKKKKTGHLQHQIVKIFLEFNNITVKKMEESLDIDWFAVDKDDNILHFASGGGKLPKMIRESMEANGFLKSFFRNLPEINSKATVSSELGKFVTLENDESRDSYLRDFVLMARRGLFSFDKTNLAQHADHFYHLVCIPQKKLLLQDLPSEVQRKLLNVRIDFNVKENKTINLSKMIL